MQRVGVPTVPGSEGLLSTPEDAAALAEEMGYPVMIKATAGGGGRGMRLVPGPDQLHTLFKAAQGEAETAFGNPGSMEKFIDRPGTWKCRCWPIATATWCTSMTRLLQRRHRLLEEAPSPALIGHAAA